MVKLSRNAEKLLSDILEHRDENGNCDMCYWEDRFKDLSFSDNALLRSLFKELKEAEMISTMWADNHPYIIQVLFNGVNYYNKAQEPATTNYTNIFYGNVNGIQIQQGPVSGEQEQKNEFQHDDERINELISLVKKYESVLDDEYGEEAALALRNSIDDLAFEVKQQSNPSKVAMILSGIRDLSINAGGGLVASGIVHLIRLIMR